jgi:tRNA U34 2-thiouridine synthase MnmA/TrmU
VQNPRHDHHRSVFDIITRGDTVGKYPMSCISCVPFVPPVNILMHCCNMSLALHSWGHHAELREQSEGTEENSRSIVAHIPERFCSAEVSSEGVNPKN